MPPAASPNRLARALALAFALAGALSVASTWTVFSQTNDEGAHVAAGMEWLDRGRYTYEAHHPPLARIADALGPWLSGVRAAGRPDMWSEGRELLYGRGQYAHDLALARAGALPFFLLAALAAWWWGRRARDEWSGAAAVLLLCLTPPVLAHAGLATNDMAVTALVPLALLAWLRWLERPTMARAVALGAAAAFAVTSKYSALPYLAAPGIVTLALWRAAGARTPQPAPLPGVEPEPAPLVRPRMLQLLAAAAVGLLVVWAVYRFTVGSWNGIPLPAPAFFRGIGDLLEHDESGHTAYLLGEIRQTGWWYYFPLALGVKTPIALLLLVALGAATVLRDRAPWDARIPLAAAGSILLVAMVSRINIGVRHVLPIYPFLCASAGAALVRLWRARGVAARAAAAGLLAWIAADGVRAHPDYLAWFNPLAGAHPERVLSDSNLDWGQDLFRLRDAIARRGIDDLELAYFGSGQLERMTPARVHRLAPGVPATGWIAISETRLADVYNVRRGGYRWLERYTPVERVGQTMRLYYIAPR